MRSHCQFFLPLIYLLMTITSTPIYLKQKIKEILAHPVYRYDAMQNHSLYAGSPGYIMLALEESKQDSASLAENVIQALQQLVDGDRTYWNGSFAGGQAGVHWLYVYLYKAGLLEDEDYELLCSDDLVLQQYALQELNRNNWDFMHGALGVAYTMLYRYQERYESFFEKVFSELNRICGENEITGLFPGYDAKTRMFVKEETDLGLAHGIPSVLKFCIQAYKQDVCKEQAHALADKIIDYLLQHTNPDKTVAYFSSVLKNGADYTRKSRLGWCYGDPGVGIVLYQAGVALGYKDLKDQAIGILRYSTQRRHAEDTDIRDAGICHGSAGVAHIYHRMWHYTQDKIFKDAADYWIGQTLALATHPEGIAGYRSYNHGDVPWVTNPGLLEGAAGVGLVLQSYLTGDYSWDYCIMLND